MNFETGLDITKLEQRQSQICLIEINLGNAGLPWKITAGKVSTEANTINQMRKQPQKRAGFAAQDMNCSKM